MKVFVEIGTKTFIRFWLVVTGLSLLGYAIFSARTALMILGTALFLALALNAPVSWLAQKLPSKSRVASTAIAYLVVVALLGTFLTLAIPPIVQQTAKFVQTVPSLVDTARTQWQGLNTVIDQYNLQPQVDQAMKAMKDNASTWATNVGENILASIGSLFSVLTASFLVLVLSFLMQIEGPAWMKKLWSLYHDKEKMHHHRQIVQRMHGVVTGYVTGQLTVSAIGAAFAGLTVFILSLIFSPVPANLAVPTAVITFIMSLIPMFGAMIGGLIVATLLVFNSIGAAITYLVYFVVYQQIENNYISPTIQSKRNDLTPLAILGSVTIGLYVFGLAGGIVSIPIAGCIKILFDAYIERNSRVKGSEDTSVSKTIKKLIAKN
ncbi:AI-2E family transporter [Candidatus Saccharibacteria bacterium]|nr:AI-2E family transporter [Candidatus Saccharibacteria bacterium]